MDIERKLDLILRDPTEEVITRDELRSLLETNDCPIAYDGFEPSGLAHLGSGVLRAIKLQDMLDAGVRFKLLVADWFGWINGKMGGDLEALKIAGLYLVEAWHACGVNTKKVDVVWTSAMVDNQQYWQRVIQVAKATTVERALRCSTIMGRKEGEMQYTAQLLYPLMQAADPFELGVDICQLGMDQRKATMLTREVGEKLGWGKPVCVHHHLLAGLQGARMGSDIIEAKMSKSVKGSAIFIHDSEEEIKDKMSKAFCEPKLVEGNPVLEICRYIIFRKKSEFSIERPSKFGGTVEYHSYNDLEKDYRDGKVHPMDLKNSVSISLNEVLQPMREHFIAGSQRELYEKVKSRVTR
ncbi:MAG: tyrosine--tRNA ligase [Candidatus Aenigmarchaeota archaeon]|nr:tyrosine--tRNA ligase [Candidatus Aenigmarchaeota archaeon]